MRWLVYILLPLQLFAQETYTSCGDLLPQNYQVSYDVDKTYYWDISQGQIIYNQGNSFTPNMDNTNESFYVHGTDSDKIKLLIIYNRWGEKVYETTSNEPWNGKDCQIGIYTYSIRTHNQHYTGLINLIR